MSFALRMYERFRVLIHEAAKFGVVGLAGFIVSLGGADILHFDAGMGKYKAVIAATVAATVVTFVGNRYWAFRHRARTGMGRETVMFFVLNGIGLLIQLACVAIVQDGANLQGKLWYNLANLLGIGLGTLFRFWSYRKWVWQTQEPSGGVPATEHRPVPSSPGFPEAPVFPETKVAGAVAAGLDEEATLYGRGAEEYEAGNYGGGQAEDFGAGNYGRGTADYGPNGNSNRDANGNGRRPGGRHAAAKQRS